MGKDEILLEVASVSLVTLPNAIKKQFEHFKDLIISPSSVRNFEVNTDETMGIATSKIKQINGLKTQISTRSKELKDPLNFIKNIVISEEKSLDEQLTMSKSLLNTKVTTFKNLKAAQLKAEEDANRAKMQEEVDRKANIISRINRTLNNFTSLLFGGNLIDNEDGESYVDIPETAKDLENIKEFISKSFPDFDVFQEFQTDIAKHYETFMNDIEMYISYINEANIDKIRKLKMKYYTLCERSEDQAKKIIQKEEMKIDKKISDDIKEAKKGIRKFIKFDIENIVNVPERFKMVDESKINKYKSDNKEKIDEAIKNGTAHDLIPGIKFRYEEKNCSY